MKKNLTLQEQADHILEEAEKRGIENNFFFVTTFKRYQVQMKMLSDLEKAITKEGAMVQKEYVKGRKNLYTNPAINEYNKTSTAANSTVQTLIKIVTAFDAKTDAQKAGESLALFISKGK